MTDAQLKAMEECVGKANKLAAEIKQLKDTLDFLEGVGKNDTAKIQLKVSWVGYTGERELGHLRFHERAMEEVWRACERGLRDARLELMNLPLPDLGVKQ